MVVANRVLTQANGKTMAEAQSTERRSLLCRRVDVQSKCLGLQRSTRKWESYDSKSRDCILLLECRYIRVCNR